MKIKYKLKQVRDFTFPIRYSYIWACGDGCCSDTEHDSIDVSFILNNEFIVTIENKKDRYRNSEGAIYHVNKWSVITDIKLYMFTPKGWGYKVDSEYEYTLKLESDDITISFEDLKKYFEIERLEDSE